MSDRSRPPVPLPYRLYRDASAQSETVAVVLLIGVTVMGTVGIVAFGSTALNDTEQRMEIQSAEHTLTQMDAQFAEVALGQSQAKSAELPRSDDQAATEVRETGWIEMEIINKTTGDPVAGSPIFNESLGAVVYENGDTEVAYQGGGVWKRSGNHTTMVSPPEFHFRGETLVLPVIQVEGDGHVSDDVTIREADATNRLYPDPSSGHANPFTGEDRTINITIGSQYYESWGEFFETRTDGRAHYDHDDETVTLELVAEVEDRVVESGIGATAAGGTLEFRGGGGNPTFVDSYNSSEGDYDDSKGWNGTVVSAGAVDISGNAEIRGNIRTGSGFEQKGASSVHGDVYWTDYYNPPGGGGGGPPGHGGGGGHNGTDYEIDGVNSQAPIDGFVDSQLNESESDNDNTGTLAEGNELDFGVGSTLTNGTYYVEELTVPSGETLVLDTTAGNITIGVEDYVDVRGTIGVLGSNRVNVYVAGESTSGGNHFELNGGEISVPDDRSTQFWIFGKRTFTAALDGDGSFKGVIYAPAASEAENGGVVTIDDAAVYGGIISGTTEFGPQSEVHFDEALVGMRAVPEDTTVVLVNYIQVTINKVEVES